MRYRMGAVLPIIFINAVLFLVQLSVPGFTQNFMLISADLAARPWIALTSMFLHGSATHLFFNMYALLMFGTLIESRIGTKRFLIAYFLSGLLASTLPSYGAALGASGAIMGIIGMTILFFPDLKVLLLFVIPMSMRTAGIIFAMFDIFGAFSPLQTGIAHWAHLVGLMTGLAYGMYLLSVRKTFKKAFHKPHHSNSQVMTEEDINEYIRNGRL